MESFQRSVVRILFSWEDSPEDLSPSSALREEHEQQLFKFLISHILMWKSQQGALKDYMRERASGPRLVCEAFRTWKSFQIHLNFFKHWRTCSIHFLWSNHNQQLFLVNWIGFLHSDISHCLILVCVGLQISVSELNKSQFQSKTVTAQDYYCFHGYWSK